MATLELQEITVRNIVDCSRCGGMHADLTAKRLTRPFAPSSESPRKWTHWALCPSNGEPLLIEASLTIPDPPELPASPR